MPRENASAKARRYLGEGRVVIETVSRRTVVASVRGDGRRYRCTYRDGLWSCTCPARSDGCAHLLATRLVVVVDLPREVWP